ncbi:MAG: sigma 54-interacting transcriptional regulator [Syntrophaceae bacterium]|jgi:transcriptional regulator with PAS, ATPase and Fis domain|nr:sigma 54-interacting transcriptional regulator [Syntrophaceae bacterium]
MEKSKSTNGIKEHEGRLFYDSILDNPFEGILAIDDAGVITYANGFFLNILQVSTQDLLGRKVWDALPGCRLYDTVLQGHSQWGENLKISGRDFLIMRFPVKQDGRIVGAVVKTIFPDMATAKGIARRVIHPTKTTEPRRPLFTCMDIIGETPPMLAAKKLARKAARTDSTLLITGESGTGKEVFAQAVHNRSMRREGPFVKVNCAAIPENLLESELFGFMDGSFTGAMRGGKPGKFELAEGGTIFLDEIGDMSLAMQAKLLTVIQEKEVERIGGTKLIALNVRITAATNKDLRRMVREGRFREDLFYRLKVLEIALPELKERMEDIPMIVDYLIKKINQRIGSDIQGVTPASMKCMMGYHWPGNVRELENMIEQAINLSEEAFIDLTGLLKAPREAWCVADADEEPRGSRKFQESVSDTERGLILDALARANGNKAKAARLLNMQRSVLYKKMARLNL